DELTHIISPPEYDCFYFRNLPDPDYEAFYFDDDHNKEISSGSTTTHSDVSLSEYDSFIFEEFVDELAHIISPLEYDCFYFRDLPDQGELMSVLNSGIRENLFTTSVNLPIEDDQSPLLAYVVWIFVAYLTYPVIPPYLHPFGNEDTIFDPGITINHFYSSKPGSSHRHGTFKKFNTHRSHLNEWPMIINGKNTPLLDVLLFHFYPLDQVKYRGNWVKLSDLKQALRGRHPMLIKTRDEESFDPIPKTPENTDDEGNGEENLGMNVGRDQGQDEKDEEDELYRDVNINLGRGVQMVAVHTTQEFED
nr:hypothetical protein [Tanacetum cinerariifolium]